MDDRCWTTNELRPISNQPGRINPRGSGALYSPSEFYTNCSIKVGPKGLLNNSILFLLRVAQRFTAAISVLFSGLALAAERDCAAHKEFFSKLRSLDSRPLESRLKDAH